MRSKLTGWVAMALLMGALAACAAEPVTLYVAPNGKDTWSGKLPAAKGNDGPLATLAGARDAVRALKRDGKLPGPVTVLLRAGTYPLSETVVFGPEDSGTAGCPIAYAAYPKENPVISGGVEIRGWRRVPGGKLWAATAPEGLRDRLKLRQLFVNGERRMLARTPNTGQFRMVGRGAPIVDPATGKETDVAKSAFRFKPGDLKEWPDVQGANVVVYYAWEVGLYPVQRLDTVSNTVYVGGSSKWKFTEQEGKQPYFIEGTLAALDAPGEWCLDSAKGEILYYPMPGEDPSKTTVVAPVTQQLILLNGEPDAGKYVDHIAFRGLHFRYGACSLEPEGHCDWQAACTIPATLQANGARDCVITQCEVAHYGNYGIWFKRGCKRNRIVYNHLFDMGAGGVRIGEEGPPPNEATETDHNMVSNNYIHGSGKVYGGAVGCVMVGHASDNVVTHNEMSDTTWMAVSVGWSWGFSPTKSHRNDIGYNHIHHIGKWLQPDCGGIYTLGLSPGTRIHHNHIHDVTSGGIYPDEGSSDLTIENNLVYDVRHGGLTVHYGRNILVRNNIFAYGWSSQIHLGRRDKQSSVKLFRNIVYASHGNLFMRECDTEADENFYWRTDGEPYVFPNELTWEQWRAKGLDARSVIADPKFVNPEARDFRLRPDSPAKKAGFEELDLREVGLTGPPEWVNLPKAAKLPRLQFADAPAEPPQLVDDGFEMSPLNGAADECTTWGEAGGATIRVTEEQAAGGKRSLKFLDAPGLDQPWNPHIWYTPRLRAGLVRLSYDVRFQKGAIVWNEWRDGASPYHSGPSLGIQANGVLKANDKEIAELPADTWIHVETTNGLGQLATGTYDLKVVIPGRPPIEVQGLTGNPAMKTLDWLGFVSNATETVAFYLDNVKLEVLKK